MHINNYHDKKIKDLCHGVKERDHIAILLMSDYFLNLDVITRNSIIVPAPQHEGFAIYTKEMAEIIASQTGCKIADILISKPRKTLYEEKLTKKKNNLSFWLKEDIQGNDIYFLDNVIDTGITFQTANRLLQSKLKPLIYAKT